jgi:hypothetical protein
VFCGEYKDVMLQFDDSRVTIPLNQRHPRDGYGPGRHRRHSRRGDLYDTAAEAADAVNRMKPVVAVPIHYGDIVGSLADAKKFKEY